MRDDWDPEDHDNAGEILTTKSVNSTVFEAGSDVTRKDVHNGEGDPYGHVMLMDWDDMAERHATTAAGQLPGITIVLESSEGSYHAWNLSVADLKTTACRLILNEDDTAHVRAGIKRGYWRLRYTAKEWEYEDSVYKDPPELVTVTVNETGRGQSLPHYTFARERYGFPDVGKKLSFNWVGARMSEEEYQTLTDDAKERFVAEED